MTDIKGDKLYVAMGASLARKRLKGYGFGVRKVESAGKHRAVIIHTATGQHLDELQALFEGLVVEVAHSAGQSYAKYESFVEHPRYGKRPIITGLNPIGVFHWHSPRECRIPNTAVEADLTRQTPATVPVSYYFSVERTCRDCGRNFIFFAIEQKHWYEELGFGLESDCVRCVPCRKRQQGIAQLRERYEELFHVADRSPAEHLEMADCSLTLVEEGVFHRRQLERVRMLFSVLADEPTVDTERNALMERVRAMESQKDE